MSGRKPLRILIVADVEPDPNSGAAGTEYQTVKALQSLGHAVDVIWKNDLSQLISHGNLHYLLELPFSYWRAIKRKIQSQNFDVIHINQPYGWYAARRLKKTGFSGMVVNRSHGWETNVYESLRPWVHKYKKENSNLVKRVLALPMHWVLKHVYPKWSVNWSDCTLVSSHEDREFIMSRYRVSDNKVSALPQGVNQEFLEREPTPMSPSRMIRILYVGQYSFVKAPDVVAEIINRLAESQASLSFTWCCDSAHHSSVSALLSTQALERTSLISWMPQEELISLYDSHGFFLFPSFYEGFGKAFLEAMSRGCIAVCSNTGGMKDIIEHGENGLLSPVGEAEPMVQGIIELLKSEQQMSAISARAASDASKYSWRHFAQKLEDLYLRFID